MTSERREKRVPLSKGLRQAIWNHYIGRDKGEAQCWVGCGADITQANFECGHVISVANGGNNHRENLRPICGACNKAMNTTHMFLWMTEHGFVSPYCTSQNFEIQDQYSKLHKLADWYHMVHIGRMICGIKIGIIMEFINIFCSSSSHPHSTTQTHDPSTIGVFRLLYVLSTGGLHIMSPHDSEIWKQLCIGVHDGTLRHDYIVVFDIHASLSYVSYVSHEYHESHKSHESYESYESHEN